MTPYLPTHSRRLLSRLRDDGQLVVSVEETRVIPPRPHEVVVRIEAAPINPSDLMTMLATADVAEGRFQQGQATFRLSERETAKRARRFDRALPVGLEGAGTVVAAGADASDLVGHRVALLTLTSGTFADYVTLEASTCVLLPALVASRDAAAMFCNPMTAFAIIETARLEGHTAIVHTAAASNLGQMLVKACREDGIPLVNLVRRAQQVDLLHSLGAEHVCDSSSPTYQDDLRRAIAATGATVAFDAIAGGSVVGELLQAMEDVAVAGMTDYSPYGSSTPKQVYIYGYLDPSPTVLNNSDYGLLWDVRHWAMPSTLARVGAERAATMRDRVVEGLTTTFASRFTDEIPLAAMLDRKTMLAYARLVTGGKFLVNPTF